MPRTFTLQLTDAVSLPVSLAAFSREDLYGEKTGEKRDAEGNALQNANLSDDGMHVFTSGGLSNLHLDSNGHLVTQFKIVDLEGKDVPMTPSMYSDQPNPIRRISEAEFCMLDVMKTYTIEGDVTALRAAITDALTQHHYLAFTYAYYSTPKPLDAVLMAVDDRVVVLLGKITEPQFFAQQITVPLDEDGDTEEEDIDFNAW